MKISKERKKHVVTPAAPKEFIYLYHRCPECEDEAEIASDTRMGNIHILKATTVMGVKQNLTNKGV